MFAIGIFDSAIAYLILVYFFVPQGPEEIPDPRPDPYQYCDDPWEDVFERSPEEEAALVHSYLHCLTTQFSTAADHQVSPAPFGLNPVLDPAAEMEPTPEAKVLSRLDYKTTEDAPFMTAYYPDGPVDAFSADGDIKAEGGHPVGLGVMSLSNARADS